MRRLVVVLVAVMPLVAVGVAAGGDARPLAVGWFSPPPFWSSDGRLAAFPRYELSGSRVSVFDHISGVERPVALPYSYTGVSFAPPDRIFVDSPQRQQVVSMTTGSVWDVAPSIYGQRSWAPDGSAFAYPSSGETVAVFELATGVRRPIGAGHLADWSPEGGEIAVVRSSPMRLDVVAVRADGSGAERPLGSISAPAFARAYVLRWSPDGQSVAIAFASTVVVFKGGAATEIAAPRYVTSIVWSPTSGRLAMFAFEKTVLVDADGGRRVEFEPALDFAWAPDGDELLYVSGGQVLARPSAGGEPTRVTSAVRFAQSPDARHLALVRRPDTAEVSDCLEDRLILFDRASGSERVLGVCWIEGASSNDDLRGSPWADELDGFAGADRLDARAGDDLLRGWGGRDRLIGGLGQDRLSGGPHADGLFARDGEADTVDCGTGRDRAVVDRLDTVARNCERVSRG